MTLPFDLGTGAALWVALVCLGAGYVRGYSGFGFAALVVTGTSLVADPLRFVPVVILADIALTAQQARGIRADVDWRRVAGLFAGCVVTVPLSVWALTSVGVDAARAVISAYVLGMCALLLAGVQLRPSGDAGNIGVGLVSGLANGAAVGGLPVAVYFAAMDVPAVVFRATLIAYFTLLDLWTLPVLALSGVFGRETLVATLVFFPLMSLGVWLGSRRFVAASPQGFRRFAIGLLAALALAGLGKSLL
ncbi:MAG: sulfite exporter TauE/SafE family protein [Gemmobacter sp.]